MSYLIPLRHRHLLGYSAIGAAAIGLSYQCIRIWNTNKCAVLEMPSTSYQQYESPKQRHILSEQLRKLIGLSYNKQRTGIFGVYHFSMTNEAALCQLALDGIDISNYIQKPEVSLRGPFDELDISKFEREISRWEYFLKILSKFKLTTTATEDELFWLDLTEFCNNNASETENLSDAKDSHVIAKTENARKNHGYVEWMKNRRLKKLVAKLAIQSEFGTEYMSNPFIISQELPRFFLKILDQFRHHDKTITLLSLKTLANTVCHAKNTAELVVKSEWLPLLATMINEPLYDEERIIAHKVLVNCLHALGTDGEWLSPDLYEFNRPAGSQTPKLDIIFVHGLRGSAFHTWRQRDNPNEKTTLFWPKDWLAKDVKQPIRIIALDYASKFFKLSKPMESIETRSKRFQSEFRNAGIGQRPIIFICHSMGGLLVKQMLTDNDELRERTVGILFISTPHRGTPIADKLARNFLHPTDDIQWLRSTSEMNQKLDQRFADLSKKIPQIWTVLECRETPIKQLKGHKSVMMVPLKSGAFERGTVYHLNEHHHHVCKPEQKGSSIYGIVYNFVIDSLSHVKS